MRFSEAESAKVTRIKAVFDSNARARRLFARYLDEIPGFVSPDMIRSLTAQTGAPEPYAFAMLLSSLFDLKESDRAFEETYIVPAVRRLSAADYRRDPYFENIRIPEVRDGAIRLTSQCFAVYRGFVSGDLTAHPDWHETVPIGYFDEDYVYPVIAEDDTVWMTLAPHDLDACQKEIADAHGSVAVFGLGLGYYAYRVSQKPEVTSVTVVERNGDVIDLFREYILPQFPHREKIRIVKSDAVAFAAGEMRESSYDYAYADLWHDETDGYPLYLAIKKCEKYHPNTAFSYWIEGFILSRMRKIVLENVTEKGGADLPVGGTLTTADQLCQLLSADGLRRMAAGATILF